MRKNKTKMQILFTSLAAVAAMTLSGCSEPVPEVPPVEPPVTEPTTPTTIAIAPYQGEKGTIIPSALAAEVGADISFTITPADDYDLFGLKVNGEALDFSNLTHDPITDAYTWNTVAVEGGFLFEPDFIEEAAVIEDGEEAVVIDGTYSRYWIKSEGNWSLGATEDLTHSTLMLDFEDGEDEDDLLTLPEWNRVVGEVVSLNGATYTFVPAEEDGFKIALPLKISGNYEFGNRGRFNLAALPEDGYQISDATFTFNEAVTSGGALFVGADAKLALNNSTFVNGVNENGEEIKALESYDNFGDLSNFTISASDLGGLPLALTHVGKVEVDGSTLGPVVINQNMVGNYFSFTNNDFGGVDKKVSPISVSKISGVHMVGTSRIEGNTWNGNDINVINGDGLSYETMFTSTELVFSEDVVVKDGLWGNPQGVLLKIYLQIDRNFYEKGRQFRATVFYFGLLIIGLLEMGS